MSSRTAVTGTTAAEIDRPSVTVSANMTTKHDKYLGEVQAPKDIQVQLHYLAALPLYDRVKPLQITPNFLDHEGRSNVRLEPGPLETLHDVRGREKDFTLDANGFRYVKSPTAFTNWTSQPSIADGYLPELEQLLKRELDGCDEIIFYDARIRQAGDEGARVSGLSYNPFARQVHVDNTETSVREKIRNTTELKADYYMAGRVRIINIWRPIKHPVYDCGLAVADGGKLRSGDVIECDRHRRDNTYWDTMGVVKYRPGFDWYYFSQQGQSDALLFKNYDSSTEVSARNCLHTAFDVPPCDVPQGAPTRESIEVRAFVFTLPQGLRRPSGDAMPHPLALQLRQGNLKLVDDENSITDRLRTDIDEGNEVKDAALLLRRREIRRLERECESLLRERNACRQALQETQMQLDQSRQQLDIQHDHIDALQRKICNMETDHQQSTSDLQYQLSLLSQELGDARMREQTSRADYMELSYDGRRGAARGGLTPEVLCLQESLDRQQKLTEEWRLCALGKGNRAVSECWQRSVDEAIMREREKDRALITTLTREIEHLQAIGSAFRA